MKRTIKGLALIAIAAIAFVGCAQSEPTSKQRERTAAETQQQHLLDLYPVPFFDTSLERSIVVQLYGLRNQARNTWSVITSDGTGKPMYDCPSIGFPIANDVQITSPEAVYGNDQYGRVTLSQPEPNGLYPAESSWGTWVLCAEPDGRLAPIYNEMDTLTFPFPVTVDYVTGRITRAGDPSMTVAVSE